MKFWLENTNILFQGDRRPFVMETVKADDNAKLGMYSIFVLFGENLSHFLTIQEFKLFK